MKHRLKQGTAMVITGPDGCDKTALAKEIAAEHGPYKEVTALRLGGPFGLGRVMEGDPATLIVEGMPTDRYAIDSIKTAITNSHVRVEVMRQRPRLVKSPNFIFCTGESEPFKLPGIGDRRFMVIRIESE